MVIVFMTSMTDATGFTPRVRGRLRRLACAHCARRHSPAARPAPRSSTNAYQVLLSKAVSAGAAVAGHCLSRVCKGRAGGAPAAAVFEIAPPFALTDGPVSRFYRPLAARVCSGAWPGGPVAVTITMARREDAVLKGEPDAGRTRMVARGRLWPAERPAIYAGVAHPPRRLDGGRRPGTAAIPSVASTFSSPRTASIPPASSARRCRVAWRPRSTSPGRCRTKAATNCSSRARSGRSRSARWRWPSR